MLKIEAKNLVKRYGSTTALSDFSINIPESSVFGLLGPNGAGKTTFVKCLLDLTNFSEGTLTIDGMSSTNEKWRRNAAYLPEKFSFYHYYSVHDVLMFYAKMRLVDTSSISEKISRAMKKLEISDLARRKVKTLSKGQLQRTAIASLLVTDCNLLVLDEPFAGLDPLGIRDIKAIILEQKNLGKTIIVNSHILSEVEQVCDEVAIVHKGKCVLQSRVSEIQGYSSLEDFFCKVIKG